LRNTISIFRVSLASISLSRLSIQSPEAGVAVVTVARGPPIIYFGVTTCHLLAGWNDGVPPAKKGSR